MLLARQREGRLKDKTADVVVHFEIRLPVLYFLFLKEWRDIGHLDVGIFGVQFLGVYLCEHIMVKERGVNPKELLKETQEALHFLIWPPGRGSTGEGVPSLSLWRKMGHRIISELDGTTERVLWASSQMVVEVGLVPAR